MKVKIGDQIYDSSLQPIMIVFEGDEKERIGNMRSEDTVFCSAPENSKLQKIDSNHDENQVSMVIENDTMIVPKYTWGVN